MQDLIKWDDLKAKVLKLPKEEAVKLLKGYQLELLANLTAVQVLQKGVESPVFAAELEGKTWDDVVACISDIVKTEQATH